MDVRETLDALERRLDALEAELGGQTYQSSSPLSGASEWGIGRSDPSFRILLEALVDVHALAALEGAVMASPRVRTLELQAYAGGWASLVVDVS